MKLQKITLKEIKNLYTGKEQIYIRKGSKGILQYIDINHMWCLEALIDYEFFLLVENE